MELQLFNGEYIVKSWNYSNIGKLTVTNRRLIDETIVGDRLVHRKIAFLGDYSRVESKLRIQKMSLLVRILLMTYGIGCLILSLLAFTGNIDPKILGIPALILGVSAICAALRKDRVALSLKVYGKVPMGKPQEAEALTAGYSNGTVYTNYAAVTSKEQAQDIIATIGAVLLVKD